jgi:hypothetical protein
MPNFYDGCQALIFKIKTRHKQGGFGIIRLPVYACITLGEKMSVDTISYLEDLETIVQETPYWLREVYGKYIVDRLRNFIIEHGGAEPRDNKPVAP